MGEDKRTPKQRADDITREIIEGGTYREMKLNKNTLKFIVMGLWRVISMFVIAYLIILLGVTLMKIDDQLEKLNEKTTRICQEKER